MLIKKEWINYKEIPPPEWTVAERIEDLSIETMENRKQKILKKMREENLDFLFVYADREHGANFGYLTGFEPRFEEAVLILHVKSQCFLMLGNENLKMAKYARIVNTAIHVPHFSLPNQPMDTEESIEQLIKKSGIQEGMRGGLIGWKMFTSSIENNRDIYDIPHFLVKTVENIIGERGRIENRTDMFIHPDYGVRVTINANEAAHFEYGASKASECIYRLMNEIKTDMTERELASHFHVEGQPLTVQPICASGQRFTNAVVAPRDKKIKLGERISMTMGLRGGLTCRVGLVVEKEEQLSFEQSDYIEKIVKPYYAAVATWYSSIRIGIQSGKIYEDIERVIPKEQYGWILNPGHLTSSEEWMSSPFMKNSDIKLKSGMMLQMDIIISVEGYEGTNAEDGILLADEELREDIKRMYPQFWERIQKRRNYMKQILGIDIAEEVLPMSIICGYLRPYLLEKGKAMCVVAKE